MLNHDFIPFNSAETELQSGINLIEASAGTGKTFAIAMLVLRFVVEKAIKIEQILVVTFTKVATDELRDRVRSRLVEARQLLLTGHSQDAVLRSWFAKLTDLAISHEAIKQRLDTALLDIDQASIFTIHSFCQKVLREHALESGQLFDAELTDDLASIKQACADDFWRKTCYSRPIEQVALLVAQYATPDALLASIDKVGERITVYPKLDELHDLETVLQNALDLKASAKVLLDSCDSAIQTGIAEGMFKGEFAKQYAAMQLWLSSQGSPVPETDSLMALSSAVLPERLNGNKFKTSAKKPLPSEEQKAAYVAALQIDTRIFDALAHAIQQISLLLRLNLLAHLRSELDKRLQQLNLLSFDNLITRLADALHSASGAALAQALRTRFACALIDEFQDTDTYQWTIFSTVFATDNIFLYLIGDPKQAIYKFRGADINSYLAAQEKALYQFTLGKNWRSHPQLIGAINTLFLQHHQPFGLKKLLFHPVEAGNSREKGELTNGVGQAIAPLMLWHAMPSKTKKDTEQTICTAVCQEIVQLLNGDHYRLQPDNLAVQPKHIAILVKANQQARDYQIALREVGVPAVLSSKESVFISHEAMDLYRLLLAVAHPSHTGLLKQALTLRWFGLDGQSAYRLFSSESALDDWMSRFLGYYQDWQRIGLMAMMQRLLSQEQIPLKLAQSNVVERCLTNIYHLIELVHQAALNEHLGINKTLDWLQTEIQKAKEHPTDNQTLRLESDEDAVQIITMHGSKGLEYEIVFCPHLWQYADRLAKEQQTIVCHDDDDNIADLGSDQFERRRKLAISEQQQEETRVLYVAVTRAKLRCYLIWTAKNAEQSALARLLGLTDVAVEQQVERLQQLVEQQPDYFAYHALEEDNGVVTRYSRPRISHDWQVMPRLRTELRAYWQMSSYTALSALSTHDTPELPEDKADESELIIIAEATSEELPKGANTGNVVHDLLENHRFADLAAGKDISLARNKACSRYSVKLARPELLNELLAIVVRTPLSDDDSDFCLMNIKETQCLKEMPFYLAIQNEMNAQAINDILSDTSAYQPLSSKHLCGYLTGFIDLICQFKGRYYVMDYKTNYLNNYEAASLTSAMREHNYGLQYWLYSVVLHRYLQNRLADYDYATHFGGVRYLFVRGMSPDEAMRGVYQDTPDLARIQRLAKLFGV